MDVSIRTKTQGGRFIETIKEVTRGALYVLLDHFKLLKRGSDICYAGRLKICTRYHRTLKK